jgi:hypothetical protein
MGDLNQGIAGEAPLRADNSSMIAMRAEGERFDHEAICLSVRPQPVHTPAPPMVQTPMHGVSRRGGRALLEQFIALKV